MTTFTAPGRSILVLVLLAQVLPATVSFGWHVGARLAAMVLP